ncbi:MAG: TonB-dependent receptor [Candidatus Omnitrophota bacterium]
MAQNYLKGFILPALETLVSQPEMKITLRYSAQKPRFLARGSLIFILLVALNAYVLMNTVYAQENTKGMSQTYYLDPVVVHPELADECYHDSLRNIENIDLGSMNTQQFSSEVLSTNNSVDVQRRGIFGTQADIQIRGASFEQTDVLIDGVKINDPQTGHFNTDIPLFSEDIDNIIMIPGPAASIYGSARQGGSIHIITKKPRKEQLKAKVIVGENSYLYQDISYSYKIVRLNSRTSLGKSTSDGYRYNTDFQTTGVSHISTLGHDFGDLNFTFNFLDKEFGANGFYSEFYPEQREHTKTIFTTLGFESKINEYSINFSPKVYYREHKDRFWLDGTRPGWYENLHTNYVQGGKVDCIIDIQEGKLFTGVDLTQEKIASASLGYHQRIIHTVYSEYRASLDKILLAIGLTGCVYDDFKDQILPDVSLGYRLQEALKIRSSFNRSVRVPTFTELYYQSPANMGNVNLAPEKSKNYELGLDYTKTYFSSSLTAFKRKGENLIDWARTPDSTVYQVLNVAEVETRGLEADLKIKPEKINPSLENWQKLKFGYTYIDKDKQVNNLISKYAFDFLKHKFTLGTEHKLIAGIILDAELSYLQRIDSGGDFIMNIKFSKVINEYTLFFNIDNIFNHGFTEKGNIPMPGRWLFFGVSAVF